MKTLLDKQERRTITGEGEDGVFDIVYCHSVHIKKAISELKNKLTIKKYNQYVKDQGFMGSFEDYIQVRILLDIGDFKYIKYG